jgi:hypothetical protein
MKFPTLAVSDRYDGHGRRLAFQIRPSVKQVMREALKRDTSQRRAAITRARLIEKAEANGYSAALHVNPIERAALVSRLRKPGMTDDEVGEVARVIDLYLSGRLCAADWRLWLRRHDEAERAAAQSPRSYHYCRTSSSDEAW